MSPYISLYLEAEQQPRYERFGPLGLGSNPNPNPKPKPKPKPNPNPNRRREIVLDRQHLGEDSYFQVYDDLMIQFLKSLHQVL